MLQNLTAPDFERLWTLGFPMPLFDELTGAVVNINALSVKAIKSNICVDDDRNCLVEQCTIASESLRDAACQAGLCTTSSTLQVLSVILQVLYEEKNGSNGRCKSSWVRLVKRLVYSVRQDTSNHVFERLK